DRELRVAARHLKQALRLQPLLPERRTLPGPPPWDEECSRGVLAEASPVERRLRELAEEQVLELVRLQQEVVERRCRLGVGGGERDAHRRPQRLPREGQRGPE